MGLFGTNIPDPFQAAYDATIKPLGEGIEHGLREVSKGLGGEGPPLPPGALAPEEPFRDTMADYEARIKKGQSQQLNEALGEPNQGTTAAQGQALQSMGLDPHAQALNNRAQRAFYQNSGDLARQAQSTALNKNIENYGRGFDSKQALWSYQRNVDYKIQQANINADATRNQVMSQIFTGFGSAAGTAAALAMRPSAPPPTPAMSSAAISSPYMATSPYVGGGGTSVTLPASNYSGTQA